MSAAASPPLASHSMVQERVQQYEKRMSFDTGECTPSTTPKSSPANTPPRDRAPEPEIIVISKSAPEDKTVRLSETQVLPALERAAEEPEVVLISTSEPQGSLSSRIERVGDLVLRAKEEFVYLYGKVGDAIVCVRIRFSDSYTVAQARGLKVLELLRHAVETSSTKVGNGVLVLKATVSDVQLRVQAKAFAGYEFAAAKALERYTQAKAFVQSVPVPMPIRAGFTFVQTKVGVFALSVRENTMYIYGKLCEATVLIRTKLVMSFDTTTDVLKAKANEVASRVMKVVDPFIAKTKRGLTSMRCKVGGAVVHISKRIDSTKELTRTAVVETYARIKKAIADLPITARVIQQFTVIQHKLGDVIVYSKDGYMHIASKAGNNVIYMRAKIVETSGVCKIVILEKYTGAKELITSVANVAAARVFAATETARSNVAAAVDYSKSVAADKPVATSAVSGAVILGAGGGALGMISGGVAGAACGLPLALFTFGLSVPIGAALGGGAGACIGATAGGAAGAAAGGAAGYGYEHRAQIKTGVDGALAKASSLRILGKGLQDKLERGTTGGTI